MDKKTVKEFITGLKEAGINFIASLSCTGIKYALPDIMKDPDFIHVPVANEGDGISACAGAYMGGKKPGMLMQNSGFILATYPLMNNIHRFGGTPMLLVIDHRGDFGDGVAEWYFAPGIQTTPILESFQIPYTIVREGNKIRSALVSGQKTTEAYGKPVAVLLSGEDIW